MPASIQSFSGTAPRLGERVYLSDTVVVIGDVEIGDDANVWFGSVLRGDVGFIRIGARTNIQDLSLVHMTEGLSNVEIGEEVTVGHGAIIHGARIGSGALIGMGAILLDNVTIGEEAMVAAGSLVPPGMQVPPRVMLRGSPARVVRDLEQSEWQRGRLSSLHYVELARKYAPK